MPAPIKARHIRRQKFSRIRHAWSRMALFLAERSATLTPTATGRTCTVTAATDVVASTAHGWLSGEGPIVFTTSGTLPAGIALLTPYYVSRIDANSFKIAKTRADLAAGTFVDITDTGSGTHTAKRMTTAAALFTRLAVGPVDAVQLARATDIDSV